MSASTRSARRPGHLPVEVVGPQLVEGVEGHVHGDAVVGLAGLEHVGEGQDERRPGTHSSGNCVASRSAASSDEQVVRR